MGDIGVIVQARMTSSRCPGKSLKRLQGVPLVQAFYTNIRRQLPQAKIIFAIPLDSKDDELADFLLSKGIPFVRGSSNDVLNRYAKTIVELGFEHDRTSIVRLTGDCVFMDGKTVLEMIRILNTYSLDYISNRLSPSFPDGLDIEVFWSTDLLLANEEFRSDFEREHVTPFYYTFNSRYNIGNISHPKDYSGFRMTFDYIEDFERVEEFLSVNNIGIYDFDFSNVSNYKNLELLRIDVNHSMRLRTFKEVEFDFKRDFKQFTLGLY